MFSDVEDYTRSNDLSDHRSHHHHHHHRHHYHHHHHHHRGRTSVGESGDDECSTDSGCSSGGSGERLFHRGSDEQQQQQRQQQQTRSGRPDRTLRASARSTRSQDRGVGVQRSSEPRGWSPDDTRSLSRGGDASFSPPSYSSSPSDAHSSSDSDSLKRHSTAETLRRAFQSLKIGPSKWDTAGKDAKKHAKKSPKRILRSPVPYMYVRGPSGLPTQRVPRNTGLQQTQPCSCQDLIGLYR